MGDRYVAYVGSYTHESNKGLYLFDMDVEKGRISKRNEYELHISLYPTVRNSCTQYVTRV